MVIAWIIDREDKRLSRIALSELTDDQLADIGVTPAEARREAARAVLELTGYCWDMEMQRLAAATGANPSAIQSRRWRIHPAVQGSDGPTSQQRRQPLSGSLHRRRPSA